MKQFEKSQSLANVNMRRKISNNESIEEESNGNTQTKTKENSPEKEPIMGKKLTNLKELCSYIKIHSYS